MNSRERIRAIIAGEPADRTGFWLGNPDPVTWPILHEYFGTSTEEELRQKLGDDFRWICPHFFEGSYRSPNGLALFQVVKTRHGQPGPFAECEDPKEVDDYPWPSVEDLDFGPGLKALDETGDFYRASGMWTCFYHNVMDLFGMEAYMMKMHTDPAVVEAVTDRVCQFYYEANERFFKLAGDRVDGFFFGNDFGTQLDLICGPRDFDRFIMPWFRQFTAQGHKFGYQVILHSCGSIHRVIGRLIEAGVDCLHPLQALARNMDADTLARDFGGRISFLGGIDAQNMLPFGSADEVAADVRRLIRVLGPRLIVSPSHEAVLPDVPPANVLAMAQAATQG